MDWWQILIIFQTAEAKFINCSAFYFKLLPEGPFSYSCAIFSLGSLSAKYAEVNMLRLTCHGEYDEVNMLWSKCQTHYVESIILKWTWYNRLGDVFMMFDACNTHSGRVTVKWEFLWPEYYMDICHGNMICKTENVMITY